MTRTKPIRLGVLISGEGTNLQAILDAIVEKRLDATVELVLSNVASAGGLARARGAGLQTLVVDHREFAGRPEFDAALVHALRARGVEWVVLAGFMRLVTRVLLDAFPMRVLNVHPALLPAFPGTHAQEQALGYGVRISGCTVHLVDAGTDTGPILAQAAVAVSPSDDVSAVKSRILAQEHALLPMVLQWIAEGRVEVVVREGQRPLVRLDGVTGCVGVAS